MQSQADRKVALVGPPSSKQMKVQDKTPLVKRDFCSMRTQDSRSIMPSTYNVHCDYALLLDAIVQLARNNHLNLTAQP